MTVLPIVERELRVAARQGATYWVRLGIAVGAIFVAAVVLVLTFGLPPQQTGRHIFEWLAGVMMVYCLAYGRRSTADCLSVEKREGTLGLLFLTDLKGHDVVLGKLVATSVRGFYGLLAMFPVLAIPLLLGGITSGEFWRVVLVLMDTFLFSLAIGMLGSALSRDQQRAMAANLTLLLLLMAAPAACMYALEFFGPGLRKLPQLLFSCPVYAFYLCDDAHYGVAPDHFWWTVGVIHGLTWLLVLTAGWIAPRAWQDRPSRAEKSRWRELWHAWRHGPVAGQGRVSPDGPWTRMRFIGSPPAPGSSRFMSGPSSRAWPCGGWCAGRSSGRVWLDPSVAVLTALLLNFTFKVWLAIEAGQQLAEDRRTGAFELLLSVPLTVKDIVRGQLLALRRQFLWPLVTVLGVGLLLMTATRRRAAGLGKPGHLAGGDVHAGGRSRRFELGGDVAGTRRQKPQPGHYQHPRARAGLALGSVRSGRGRMLSLVRVHAGQDLVAWLAILPEAVDGPRAGGGSGLWSDGLVATAHAVSGTSLAPL